MYSLLCFEDYLCGHQWIASPKLPSLYTVTPKYGVPVDSYIFSNFVCPITNALTNLWMFNIQN